MGANPEPPHIIVTADQPRVFRREEGGSACLPRKGFDKSIKGLQKKKKVLLLTLSKITKQPSQTAFPIFCSIPHIKYPICNKTSREADKSKAMCW